MAKLVRIHPSNARESHTIIPLGIRIEKSNGWCRVSDEVAAELEKERMSSLNPLASPRVFEIVADPAEAKRIEQAQSLRPEPVGTPDAPLEKVAKALVDPDPEDGEEPHPEHKHGGRRGKRGA